MATVNAISRNMYSMFRLAQTNSDFARVNRSLSNTQNFFNTSLGVSSGKGQTGPFFSSDSLTQLQDVVAKRLAETQDTVKKLDEYAKVSDKFYTGFFTETSDLKDSSAALSRADFSADKTTDILGAVKQFAADYNSTAAFLSDNSTVSTNVAYLADSFSTSKYAAASLASVGVNVDEAGQLSVDETKLSAALTENADKVGDVLGRNGLAGKTAKKVNAAVNNASNLVPFPQISNRSMSGLSQGFLLDLFV